MVRLNKLRDFSGEAGGMEEALHNPLSLISRPLYLDSEGLPDPNLQRWEFPTRDVQNGTAQDYARHKKSDAIVVVGGFEFIVELGVIPRWLVDDATRHDAGNLLRERGLVPLLEDLAVKGRESGLDLFGKASLHEWFKYSPRVMRDESRLSHLPLHGSKKVTARFLTEQRRRHPIRLRKAIELFTLFEAALRYRFSTGRTINRASNYTGLPSDEIYPEVIWDVLWLEPINYVMSVSPVKEHIPTIMDNARYLEYFRELCGEGAGALYWAMKGVPSKYPTIQAACKVCNEAYGRDFPPSNVTSVPPREFKKRLKEINDKSKNEYKLTMERAPEMGHRPF